MNVEFRLKQYQLLSRVPVGCVLQVNTQRGFQYEVLKVSGGVDEAYIILYLVQTYLLRKSRKISMISV